MLQLVHEPIEVGKCPLGGIVTRDRRHGISLVGLRRAALAVGPTINHIPKPIMTSNPISFMCAYDGMVTENVVGAVA